MGRDAAAIDPRLGDPGEVGDGADRGGDEGAVAGRRDLFHLAEQVVDLRAGRAHVDDRALTVRGMGRDAAAIDPRLGDPGEVGDGADRRRVRRLVRVVTRVR
jgi:hypothetical protein